MRLTADLILSSPSFLNPLGDRELSLRGNKISVIENLGATQDGFDTMDLSDNEIQKLENFPLLRRLRTLFLHNNHISTAAPKLGESLPKLEALLLTNNKFETLADLNPLHELSSLKMLSLVNNPVTKLKNYRVYVVHLLPQLRVLDFVKIKASEKRQARGMFKKEGEEIKAGRSVTFTPGEAVASKRTTASAEAIKAAIQNAKSLEEVQSIERSIQQGTFDLASRGDGKTSLAKGTNDNVGEDTAQRT